LSTKSEGKKKRKRSKVIGNHSFTAIRENDQRSSARGDHRLFSSLRRKRIEKKKKNPIELGSWDTMAKRDASRTRERKKKRRDMPEAELSVLINLTGGKSSSPSRSGERL